MARRSGALTTRARPQVIDNDITPKREQLGADRAKYLEFSQLKTEMEGLKRFVVAYDYTRAEENRQKCEEAQAGDVAQRATLTETITSADTEVATLKQQQKEVLAQKKAQGAAVLDELEKKEQDLGKELTKISAEGKQLREVHATDSSTQEANATSKAELEAEVKKCDAEQKKAAAAAEKAAKAHEENTEKLQNQREFIEAQMGLGKSNGEGAKNLQAQLSDANSEAKARETELKAAEMKKKELEKQAKEATKKLAETRKAGDKQEKELAELEKQVGDLSKKREALNYDEQVEVELGQQQHARQSQHAQLSRKQDELAGSLAGLDFKYTDPERGFDRSRVKGTIAANLSISDQANVTALESLAGGRLHHVIVDDLATGSLLFSKGNLQRRVTLIPLDKIRPVVLAADKVAAAKKLVGADKVHLAVDLLDFQPEVAAAMRHIFGNALVCADKSGARSVCEKLGLRTVTLEGDVYDPSGVLTGGSRARGNASVLCRLSELTKLRRELSACEKELGQLASQLETCRKKAERYDAVQQELALCQQKLDLHRQMVRSSESGQLAGNLEKVTQQLNEVTAAAAAAKTTLAECTALRDRLASQLKDFEGNREERMKEAKVGIAAAEKQAKASAKALEAAQQATQKLSLEREEAVRKIAEIDEQMAEVERDLKKQAERVERKAAEEAKKQAEHTAAEAALQERQAALGAFDAEATRLKERQEEVEKAKESATLELREIDLRGARAQKDLANAEARCTALVKEHTWIESEKAEFGKAGGAYDFKKGKPATAQQTLQKKEAQLEAKGKGIKKDVLSQFERAEQDYAELMEKKDTVEKDKKKIEDVIAELDRKKVEELCRTWKKVNKDFGAIFSTLLPGAGAKLEPLEGKGPEEGLVIKASIRSEQQSLTECSGGQKSLLALSLMLSLLRFKPAPVYILDEVDSALDENNTHNIGTMIRTHFKQSQFLIISHKEGMFGNASSLFHVALVDGASTVTRTNGAAAAPQSASAAPTAGAKKGVVAQGKRKALTSVNAS